MLITHLTAHLGAGAGKAIVGIACLLKEIDPSIIIHIILCEKPIKMQAIELATQRGINVHIQPSDEILLDLCTNSDFVVINWWAHPGMYPVLNKLNGLCGRFILWNHFNGCIYPRIHADFCTAFLHTLFTCEYSLENDEWSEQQKNWVMNHSDIIYGLGDFEPETWNCKETYRVDNECIVGYLGTIDYNKLNVHWLNACEEISRRRPDVRFILFGDISEQVRTDICNSVIADKIDYRGYTNNSNEAFLEMDILGYPLNVITSGTTENVLLEAMASGVPCVVLDQGTEKYIIENYVSGICTKDMETYVDDMVDLIDSEFMREQIGRRARQRVTEKFNGRTNAMNFLDILHRLYLSPKQPFDIDLQIGKTPADYFRNCYPYKLDNTLKSEVLNIVLKSETKSSLKHFQKVFPYDEELNCLRIE